MTTEPLTIGEAAARAAVTPDTLRYYERRGLLPPPPRTQGGYRIYDPATVERVAFIRKAQTLSLTLDDVREILRVAEKGTPPCEHVRATLHERLQDVDSRIAALQSLRVVLAKALARTRTLPLARTCVCDIIEGQKLPRQPSGSRHRARSKGKHS